MSFAGIFSPFGIKDYFFRMEFQQRGSPHMHGLCWLDDAPEYIPGNNESIQNCIAFIDKFITCSRNVDAELHDLIQYQVHKHANTCKKKVGKNKCRFGFPKPPLPETLILEPLPVTTRTRDKEKFSEIWKSVAVELNRRGRNPQENPEISDFLTEIGISYENYIFGVRSTLKRPTVFLKRQLNEAFVNPYNPEILRHWRANIDIQFVLDTYACAKYCVGYMMKSYGGISKTMRQINQAVSLGNEDICEKLRKFSKVMWTGSEISAQEAAGFLLGISNTDSSRSDIFVNTSPVNERTFILKPMDELKKLEDDCEDVVAQGLLDHYANRSEDLEDLCLAEIATNYEFVTKTSHKSEEAFHRAEARSNYFLQIDGSGFFRLRTGNRKILRYRHYSKNADCPNYYREQLTLFLPWRDEDRDINRLNMEQKLLRFTENEVCIEQNSKPYFKKTGETDQTIRVLVDNGDNSDHDTDEDMDEQDREELLENFRNASRELELQEPTTEKIQPFLPPRMCQNDEYVKTMRNLNDKQRRFVLEVMHRIKCDKTPFHVFLSGGAGVGKSHTITAIVQTTLRFFSSKVDRDQNQTPVVVSAFTGKAAFNVFGMTLHTTYRLPPTQSDQMIELDENSANGLRLKLAGLKLIIIDEISMVSLRHLKLIDFRLRQIFGTRDIFGGISVLVVGHLRQLTPIGGASPFQRQNGIPNHLWESFYLFEQDEIMRQKGDVALCNALNNMSECQMTHSDIQLFKSREICTRLQPPIGAIWLFKTNAQCEEYNAMVHSRMNSEGFLSTALDRPEGRCSAKRQQEVIEIGKKLNLQSCDGLRFKVNLKVGAQYFVSTNINVQDGLFNGATGTLKKLT